LRFYVPSQYSQNKAVSDFDRKHSLVMAGGYELPFGKGKPYLTDGAASHILGGWQVNPLMTWYSGTPFFVSADGSSLNAPGNQQIADQIDANVPKLGGVGLGAPYYSVAPFRPVTEARFGNMGLNALRGPWLFNTNLSVFRKFFITEHIDLQFRAEALNLTNTPALANPNNNVSSPSNFMAITTTNTSVTTQQRTLRFGLRLGF
jgi:hypothetical protein